jgi:hypothetical protein
VSAAIPANATGKYLTLLSHRGVKPEPKPERTAEEWFDAAADSRQHADGEIDNAFIATSFEEAEECLRKARHQLHIAEGQLKRHFKAVADAQKAGA